MAIKHALIVDDSRSARAVLRRMLEEFNLKVDAVESADEAILYLQKHKPDVIFMDHMMPGMDGFEAVKHIKNNPLTARIPIMMYTTRSGELYLSRARALGAIGIISKTISPVGLKESLFKLGLLEERRREERRNPSRVVGKPLSAKADSNDEESQPRETKTANAEYLNDLSKLMDEQTIELHKSMWLSVESVSNEIFNRLKAELEEKFEKLQSLVPQKKKSPWPLSLSVAMLLISLALNVFLLVGSNQRADHNLLSTAQPQGVAANNMNPPVTVNSDPVTSVDNQLAVKWFMQWAQNKTIEYPFDELALNDSRLPAIEEIIQKAVAAGYSGDILLQTHVGLFCMVRDLDGNYTLAADELPVTNCDLIGNAVQPSDLPSTHQSLSFANYLSDDNLLADTGVEVEVTNLARNIEVFKYPEQNSQTTVKEWNRAARANNFIIVKLIPDSADHRLQ
jgi:CheY-like chemotaxis protein